MPQRHQLAKPVKTGQKVVFDRFCTIFDSPAETTRLDPGFDTFLTENHEKSLKIDVFDHQG